MRAAQDEKDSEEDTMRLEVRTLTTVMMNVSRKKQEAASPDPSDSDADSGADSRADGGEGGGRASSLFCSLLTAV